MASGRGGDPSAATAAAAAPETCDSFSKRRRPSPKLPTPTERPWLVRPSSASFFSARAPVARFRRTPKSSAPSPKPSATFPVSSAACAARFAEAEYAGTLRGARTPPPCAARGGGGGPGARGPGVPHRLRVPQLDEREREARANRRRVSALRAPGSRTPPRTRDLRRGGAAATAARHSQAARAASASAARATRAPPTPARRPAYGEVHDARARRGALRPGWTTPRAPGPPAHLGRRRQRRRQAEGARCARARHRRATRGVARAATPQAADLGGGVAARHPPPRRRDAAIAARTRCRTPCRALAKHRDASRTPPRSATRMASPPRGGGARGAPRTGAAESAPTAPRRSRRRSASSGVGRRADAASRRRSRALAHGAALHRRRSPPRGGRLTARVRNRPVDALDGAPRRVGRALEACSPSSRHRRRESRAGARGGGRRTRASPAAQRRVAASPRDGRLRDGRAARLCAAALRTGDCEGSTRPAQAPSACVRRPRPPPAVQQRHDVQRGDGERAVLRSRVGAPARVRKALLEKLSLHVLIRRRRRRQARG